MARVLKADTTPSTELDLEKLKQDATAEGKDESKPEPQAAQFARKN
jgi:hypothetical protein